MLALLRRYGLIALGAVALLLAIVAGLQQLQISRQHARMVEDAATLAAARYSLELATQTNADNSEAFAAYQKEVRRMNGVVLQNAVEAEAHRAEIAQLQKEIENVPEQPRDCALPASDLVLGRLRQQSGRADPGPGKDRPSGGPPVAPDLLWRPRGPGEGH